MSDITSDIAAPSNSDNSPAGTASGAGGWSDRILGIVCLITAVLYSIEARTFDGTAFSSGPVGPKTLPTGIGVLFGVLSLILIFKPDAPPRWPTKSAWWQIGLVIVSSYVYGQVIEPIGFIASSAAMTIIIGVLFKAPPIKLVPLSFIFPTILAFIFNNWLSLQLPAGWWGGF